MLRNMGASFCGETSTEKDARAEKLPSHTTTSTSKSPNQSGSGTMVTTMPRSEMVAWFVEME